VNFSSQEISVTTCILLRPYFTIHGNPLLDHALHPCPRPSFRPFTLLHACPPPPNPSSRPMARRFSRHCLIHQLRNKHPNIHIQPHITKCKSPRFIIIKSFLACKWSVWGPPPVCSHCSQYNYQIAWAISCKWKIMWKRC
jgi:hypothetical protein